MAAIPGTPDDVTPQWLSEILGAPVIAADGAARGGLRLEAEVPRSLPPQPVQPLSTCSTSSVFVTQPIFDSKL